MKKATKITTAVLVSAAIIGGGAAYAGKGSRGDHAEHADYAVGFIAKKLELDPTQEQALSVLKDQLLVARSAMQDQRESTISEVRELISADSFNQAQALELINSKTATVDSMAPEIVGALGNFLDSLDAEQKAEIVEFMESRKRGHKRGRWGH